MNQDSEVTEFSWVKARQECSMANMFLGLKEEVEKDVQAAKTLFKGTGRAFDFKTGSDSFTVYEGVRPLRTVKFSLDETGTKIVVEQDNGDGQPTSRIEVGLTLNKEKQCRFIVGDEELESWHLRKRSLERLFFSIPIATASGFKGI